MAVATPINGGNGFVQATAIPVTGGGSTNATSSSAAVPNIEFMNDIPLQVAPALHTYEDNSPEAQNHAVAQKTRIGSDIGRVNAVQERQRIRNLNGRTKSQTGLERTRVINARDVAQQRVAEGFDVREDKYFNPEAFVENAIEKKLKDQDKAYSDAKKEKQVGYEVQEYDVAEYAGNEYDTSYEYKSVYD